MVEGLCPVACLQPCDQGRRLIGQAWQWAAWITAGIALDLAAWSGMLHFRVFNQDPGSASAVALCWVHGFVLPVLFGRPWRGLLRLVLAAGAGWFAAVAAVVIGTIAGLQVGFLVMLPIMAFGGPVGECAPYHAPPGPLLMAVEDWIGAVLLWSGVAAGAATAAVAAIGMAALLPGLQRPRISWRVALAGAWASIVFLPDWEVRGLLPPWREPSLLVVAALPWLVFVNWRAITSTRPG